MAKSKPTKMLAVLGRCRRTGRWRLASRSSILALLGTCHLDMRNSFVDAEELKMKVTVILGSATFIVPNGAEVRPSGMSLLGGSTVDVPEHDDAAELPTLEIEWTSILGRIRIVTEETIAVDPVEAELAGPALASLTAVTGGPPAPAVEAGLPAVLSPVEATPEAVAVLSEDPS